MGREKEFSFLATGPALSYLYPDSIIREKLLFNLAKPLPFCYMQPNTILMETVSKAHHLWLLPPLLPLVLLSSCSNFSDRMEPCISWKCQALCLCARQALCKPFLLSNLLDCSKSFFHGLLHSGWALSWMGELPFVRTALAPHTQLSHGIYHFSREWLCSCSLPSRQQAPRRSRSVRVWTPGAMWQVLGNDGWTRTLLTPRGHSWRRRIQTQKQFPERHGLRCRGSPEDQVTALSQGRSPLSWGRKDSSWNGGVCLPV